MATLLTGTGYIGAALLGRLDASAAPVVALESFYSTRREALEAALPGGVELVQGDVAEPSDVARAFDRIGSDHDVVVFHLAAQPSAAVARRDPETTERSNLTGARVLLETAGERGARVVFGGSFRVYGDDLAGHCVDEQTPYGPVADLSHLSKIYVEQLARMLRVRFVSVRLGITYGLSPIMKSTPEFMTVPNLFCQRAARGEVLQVLEDRPMAFIHVADAAEALVCASEQQAEEWQAFNAATQVATVGEVARTVQRLMRERGDSVRVVGASSQKSEFEVRSTLNLRPRFRLETGLEAVLEHFRATR